MNKKGKLAIGLISLSVIGLAGTIAGGILVNKKTNNEVSGQFYLTFEYEPYYYNKEYYYMPVKYTYGIGEANYGNAKLEHDYVYKMNSGNNNYEQMSLYVADNRTNGYISSSFLSVLDRYLSGHLFPKVKPYYPWLDKMTYVEFVDKWSNYDFLCKTRIENNSGSYDLESLFQTINTNAKVQECYQQKFQNKNTGTWLLSILTPLMVIALISFVVLLWNVHHEFQKEEFAKIANRREEQNNTIKKEENKNDSSSSSKENNQATEDKIIDTNETNKETISNE